MCLTVFILDGYLIDGYGFRVFLMPVLPHQKPWLSSSTNVPLGTAWTLASFSLRTVSAFGTIDFVLLFAMAILSFCTWEYRLQYKLLSYPCLYPSNMPGHLSSRCVCIASERPCAKTGSNLYSDKLCNAFIKGQQPMSFSLALFFKSLRSR